LGILPRWLVRNAGQGFRQGISRTALIALLSKVKEVPSEKQAIRNTKWRAEYDKFRGHRNHAKFMVSIKSFTISVHLRHKQAASGKWQVAGCLVGRSAGESRRGTQYGNEPGQKRGPKNLLLLQLSA